MITYYELISADNKRYTGFMCVKCAQSHGVDPDQPWTSDSGDPRPSWRICMTKVYDDDTVPPCLYCTEGIAQLPINYCATCGHEIRNQDGTPYVFQTLWGDEVPCCSQSCADAAPYGVCPDKDFRQTCCDAAEEEYGVLEAMDRVSFNAHHPELLPGETFFGNSCADLSDLQVLYPDLKLRQGTVAYSASGITLQILDYHPYFCTR